MKFIFAVIIFISGVVSKSPLSVPYVGLNHVGSINSVNDEGTNYEKNFFFSSYLTSKPIYARSICKSFGSNMDIASFENRGELERVQVKLSLEMNYHQSESTNGVIVGAMAHNLNDRKVFFWTTTGLIVDQPVSTNQSANCIGVVKNRGNLIFTEISCDKEYTFLCQNLELIYAN